MCGIIGAVGNVSGHWLRQLFEQSKVRGMHAYGFACERAGVVKRHDLDALQQDIPDRPGAWFIGHCRYSTSGDYLEHANNQPLSHNGVVLAFNGVIDMGTKAQIERRYGVKLAGDNDGYLLMQKLGVEKFLNSPEITFAAIWNDGTGVKVRRNERRPAWICEQDGARYVASTRDIFKRAGFTNEPEPLPPNITRNL